MMPLIVNEWVKTFTKWRTYLGFLAIGVFLPLVFVAMKLSGAQNEVLSGLNRMQEFFIISGNLFNCFFVTRFMMMTFFVHIPFLITLVGGDMLAGEATAGTYRILLVRPPSRFQIALAKVVVTELYTFLLLLFMLTLSLGLGYALFGSGVLVLTQGGLGVVPPGEALWRTAGAYGLAFLSMSVVAGLSFLFSSFVENAIGPIIGAMVVVVIFLIITEAPFSAFDSVRPFLFTTYSSVWLNLFALDIPWRKVAEDAAILLLYGMAFYATGIGIFVRRDILS